jgi:two-component sensor histidine kinase
MFRESQNRILSMAMIHEKLYQSEGLHQIDLKDYIDDLAREVFTSFGDLAAGVSLQTEVAEIALGLDTAIPCGLIIIELVSNALKYAFPPPCGGGEIFIILRPEDQGWFGLTVSDNGVGLPPEVEIQNLKSLGLRLVADLARYQIDGDLRVSREKGTRVYVRFKEKAKPSRREDNA